MTDLSVRSRTPERMDDPALAPHIYDAVLADLARVNTVTRARVPTLAFIAQALAAVPPEQPVTILDLGFGDGDMLRAIAHRFGRRPGLRLIGYDINPRSATAARSRTPDALPIRFVTGDATAVDPAQPIDLIISSLVTHHMDDGEIVAFLRWMEARAARGWFVNDLHRHALAYHGFRLLAAVAGWHPIVRHDGALSVLRSFRRADWLRLTATAGLDPAIVRLRWHFPFRWCLGRAG